MDFKPYNNKRQLDIAYAAMVHVSYGDKFLRWLVMKLIKYWSNRCAKFIDQEWIDGHSGLIAGDWQHFKTNEERHGDKTENPE